MKHRIPFQGEGLDADIAIGQMTNFPGGYLNENRLDAVLSSFPNMDWDAIYIEGEKLTTMKVIALTTKKVYP